MIGAALLGTPLPGAVAAATTAAATAAAAALAGARRPAWVLILALAVAYFLSARLGLLLALPGGHVTPVWPPSGIALGALLLCGRRVWPGIWLGSFAANLWDFFGSPMGLVANVMTSATFGAGASAAALLGAQWLRRSCGSRHPLERVRDVCAFMAWAGAASCLVSATVGVTMLCGAGFAPWSAYAETWLTWWLGDTAGVFVAAPLLLVWQRASVRTNRADWVQAACCFGLLVAVTSYVFINDGAKPLTFIIIPFLVWPAMRFAARGAATSVALVAVLAVWGTIHGSGPFSSGPRNESLLLLELFLSVVVLTALCIAAIVTEREQAQAAQQRTFDELEARVRDRTAALHRANGELSAEITERKRADEALRELNEALESKVAARTLELTGARDEAEQANRAKSAFLAAMSHEIRTPMNGVVGMIDVLEHSSLDDTQVEIVKTARESAHALLAIVDDVLDFSKIEAGQFPVDSEPMTVASVVEGVRDTLNHLAGKQGVALVLFADPAIPEQLLGDATRLRQVLLNLTGNAIKFSGGGERSGRVALRSRLLKGGAQQVELEFSVADNGIGMDQATLARLFTRFTQADAGTTRRFGGTGLGLSISHGLVELMGGSIAVHSEPGRGSTFSVRLPLALPLASAMSAATVMPQAQTARPRHAAVPRAAPSWALARARGRLILVAEDNHVNQKVVLRQLALLGYAADVVANGCEAFEHWQRGEHALLLTDLHMPQMDGYELAQAIRLAEGSRPRMPIIALTANALKGEAKRCRDLGMDDYMTKPVQLAALQAMLDKWLPQASAPSQYSFTPGATPSPVACVPALDVSVLKALVGDEPQVIAEFLHDFRIDALMAVQQMRAALQAQQPAAIESTAHRLKSSARSVGALALGELCERVEHAAQAGRVDTLAEMWPGFEAEMAAVQACLPPHQSDQPDVGIREEERP